MTLETMINEYPRSKMEDEFALLAVDKFCVNLTLASRSYW